MNAAYRAKRAKDATRARAPPSTNQHPDPDEYQAGVILLSWTSQNPDKGLVPVPEPVPIQGFSPAVEPTTTGVDP
jgi:hypothetical protein